jgi:hypothetical protein
MNNWYMTGWVLILLSLAFWGGSLLQSGGGEPTEAVVVIYVALISSGVVLCVSHMNSPTEGE